MSAKSETKFPTPDFPGDFRTGMFSARRFGLYQVTEVNDWLKRCIDDFPPCPIGVTNARYIDFIDEWFDRWFSQFETVPPKLSEMDKENIAYTIFKHSVLNPAISDLKKEANMVAEDTDNNGDYNSGLETGVTKNDKV